MPVSVFLSVELLYSFFFQGVYVLLNVVEAKNGKWGMSIQHKELHLMTLGVP